MIMKSIIPTVRPWVYRITYGEKTWDILQFEGEPEIRGRRCMLSDQIHDFENHELLEAISRRE